MSLRRRVLKLPWYLRQRVVEERILSRARILRARLGHPRARIEFRGPARVGRGFRLAIAGNGTFIAGPGVDFRRGFRCEIAEDGRVVIGGGTTFTYHGTISCERSIEIGSGCAFGQAVLIADRPPAAGASVEAEADRGPLRIGNRVGVSDKSLIYADVGEGSLVASQAIVSAPMPPHCVAAGAPARAVRRIGSAS